MRKNFVAPTSDLSTDCAGGMEPVRCVDPCPSKCHYLAQDRACVATKVCFPGCSCPKGKVLGEEGKCVEPMDCSCKDEDGNKHEVSTRTRLQLDS